MMNSRKVAWTKETCLPEPSMPAVATLRAQVMSLSHQARGWLMVRLKVKKGEKLIILEAMKMQTTVYALTDGIIDQVEVQAGDQVESKDLLVKLR